MLGKKGPIIKCSYNLFAVETNKSSFSVHGLSTAVLTGITFTCTHSCVTSWAKQILFDAALDGALPRVWENKFLAYNCQNPPTTMMNQQMGSAHGQYV